MLLSGVFQYVYGRPQCTFAFREFRVTRYEYGRMRYLWIERVWIFLYEYFLAFGLFFRGLFSLTRLLRLSSFRFLFMFIIGLQLGFYSMCRIMSNECRIIGRAFCDFWFFTCVLRRTFRRRDVDRVAIFS